MATRTNNAAAKKFDTFDAFYPFYLSEHSDPMTRRLHFAGSALALLCLVMLVVTMNPWWLLAGVLCGYGFAWIGHYRVREEPTGLVQAAAVQFHGRLEDVLADPDGKDFVLTSRRCKER